MKLPADLDPSRTRRRARERVIAPIAALLVLMACLVLPLIVQALVLGLGPDSPLPDSAERRRCGVFGFRVVLVKFGGFDTDEVDRMWLGRNKRERR